VKTLKKRGQFEDVSMEDETTSGRNVDWIYQAQDRSHWRASVNIVMVLLVLKWLVFVYRVVISSLKVSVFRGVTWKFNLMFIDREIYRRKCTKRIRVLSVATATHAGLLNHFCYSSLTFLMLSTGKPLS
jgi:hypothetical protein